MTQKDTTSQDATTSNTSRSSSILPIIVTALITTLIVGGGIMLFTIGSDVKQIKEESDQFALRIDEVERSVSQWQEAERRKCNGTWKDGICMQSTCIDSDINERPDDIFMKGTVTYTDTNGEASTVSDSCTGSKNQVNEMYCYQSPQGSGNYVRGTMVYDCENGCLDGACIK